MVENINKLKNQILYNNKDNKFNVNQQDLQQALNYCRVIEKEAPYQYYLTFY